MDRWTDGWVEGWVVGRMECNGWIGRYLRGKHEIIASERKTGTCSIGLGSRPIMNP